jgi:hypothetical protein
LRGRSWWAYHGQIKRNVIRQKLNAIKPIKSIHMNKNFENTFSSFARDIRLLSKDKSFAKLFIPFAVNIGKQKQIKFNEIISRNTNALSTFHPLIIQIQKRKSDPTYFNLFKILNVNRREYIHSNILHWLLDPKGNHGLGVEFINEVFKAVELPEITEKDICSVSREEQCEECIIDIKVSTESSLLFIENKIDSGEGFEQTQREYRDLRTMAENKLHYKGIFLTLSGDEPNAKEFIAWDYYRIINIIELLLDNRKENNEIKFAPIKFFLSNYVQTLRQMI